MTRSWTLTPASWKNQSHTSQDRRVADVVKMLDDVNELCAGDFVVLGICNDLGVQANGGRVGAVEGPYAFRQALGRLPFDIATRPLYDGGDLPSTTPYEDFFSLGGERIASILSKKAIPILIGGGHDCSLASYRGCRSVFKDAFTVLTLDAHCDVRPVLGPNNGNPFFRMMEEGLQGHRLMQTGLNPFVNALAHQDYLRDRGAELHFLDEDHEHASLMHVDDWLRRDLMPVLATIDMDVFHGSDAPGVSALNPWGIKADEGMEIMRLLGSNEKVIMLDLMELCPTHDREGLTAKLMAHMVAYFMQATSQRQSLF